MPDDTGNILNRVQYPASRTKSRNFHRQPIWTMITLILCILALVPVVSATEYVLVPSTMDSFKEGIHYAGDDTLALTIGENVTISGTSSAGIESTAPVTIRSPAGKTLTILVDNDSELLYGIHAPSVSVESGALDITVMGQNDGEKGNAFGICAGSGNVTIAGGSISTNVETTGHKNKGIYASRYIVISGGIINASQYGGSNTFGLDGGEVDTENADGGIIISGGRIQVSSGGGKARNIGIDSKFGTVRISGNTAMVIRIAESGTRQNFAFNPNITYIDGING